MKQLSNKGQSTTLGGCLLIRSGLTSTNGSAQLVNVKSHLSHKRPENNLIFGSFTPFFTNKKQSLKIYFFKGKKEVKMKWYFVTKIVLTYCEKNFEISRTICSNSERSQQFLIRECRLLRYNKLEQLEFKL